MEGLGFGITVLSEPTAEVLIRDNDIAVTINYRHNAESDGRKQDITVFQAVFESDLAEFYQLASDITSYAQNNCFLEQSAMNYFSGFMGLSDGALPPTDGRAEIGTSSPHQWSIRDVEDMLRPKTKEAVARIGFFNTSGFVWPETDEAGEYDWGSVLHGMLAGIQLYPELGIRYINGDLESSFLQYFIKQIFIRSNS